MLTIPPGKLLEMFMEMENHPILLASSYYFRGSNQLFDPLLKRKKAWHMLQRKLFEAKKVFICLEEQIDFPTKKNTKVTNCKVNLELPFEVPKSTPTGGAFWNPWFLELFQKPRLRQLFVAFALGFKPLGRVLFLSLTGSMGSVLTWIFSR